MRDLAGSSPAEAELKPSASGSRAFPLRPMYARSSAVSNMMACSGSDGCLHVAEPSLMLDTRRFCGRKPAPAYMPCAVLLPRRSAKIPPCN